MIDFKTLLNPLSFSTWALRLLAASALTYLPPEPTSQVQVLHLFLLKVHWTMRWTKQKRNKTFLLRDACQFFTTLRTEGKIAEAEKWSCNNTVMKTFFRCLSFLHRAKERRHYAGPVWFWAWNLPQPCGRLVWHYLYRPHFMAVDLFLERKQLPVLVCPPSFLTPRFDESSKTTNQKKKKSFPSQL